MNFGDPLLPIPPSGDEFLKRLNFRLTTVLRDIQTSLKQLATGSLVGTINATTAAPTTGTYAVGDFIKKSNPTEAGSAGSKYIIIGWVCVTAGTPGTWRECRTLTGN